MSANDSILHQLALSLRNHVTANWLSELYDASGNRTREGVVHPDLASTFTYTDRNGAARIFGPSVVQVGRFQDDPLSLSGMLAVPSSFVQIRPNDPTKPGDWQHALASPADNAGVRPMWTYEVGGGIMLWRRFLVEFTLYTIDSDQTQEENYRLGAGALSYLESLCTSRGTNRAAWAWPMHNENGRSITDPFGEQALQSIVVKSEVAQRGGPDTVTTGDYICDGKLWLQVQTHR